MNANPVKEKVSAKEEAGTNFYMESNIILSDFQITKYNAVIDSYVPEIAVNIIGFPPVYVITAKGNKPEVTPRANSPGANI